MQNPFKILIKSRNDVARYILLAISIFLVFILIPKKGKFKYEYEQGKPWMQDDLPAPFTFAVQKPSSEIKQEQKAISDRFKPYYSVDSKVENLAKDKFIKECSEALKHEADISDNLRKYYFSRGLTFLDDIYREGIIQLDTIHKNKPETFLIIELKNNIASQKLLANYYQLPNARSEISSRIEKDSILNKSWFSKSVLSALEVNVTYNKPLSEKSLKELLETVSKTRGVISQDQKIITRGSIVTPERFQVLESLKAEYESNVGKNYTISLGYLIIIASLFLMFAINFELFHRKIAAQLRSLIFILAYVVILTAITTYITETGIYSVYAIPYCLLPIVVLAFFGSRMAISTHLLVIFICGIIVPNPFEFVLLQSFAGFTAILSLSGLKYISRFFIASMLVLLVYLLLYFGITLIKTSSLNDFDWDGLKWFGINFILTLLAYPLVYVNEKIFGLVSDIRLLELSDIQNKIMKELFLKAPGTFQHSLQVSNLAESVIDSIGGNSLLARVGALYHDIGKIYNPEFFIENQKGNENTHKDLTELESASIIIAHVKQGVEYAQKNHLPPKVIDFIRTHHGTSRVEYFYRNYLLDHADADETGFRYPGPKPSSKEMAVVMMADSVEAASRSIQNIDAAQIDAVVDKIIDSKIKDNQFDNASITIQEINYVRRILKKLIMSIYHIRIPYPPEMP